MDYANNAKNAALQGAIGNAYGVTTGGHVHFQRQDGPGTSVTIAHQLSGVGAERLDKVLREIIADDGPILQAEQRAAYERQVAEAQRHSNLMVPGLGATRGPNQ